MCHIAKTATMGEEVVLATPALPRVVPGAGTRARVRVCLGLLLVGAPGRASVSVLACGAMGRGKGPSRGRTRGGRQVASGERALRVVPGRASDLGLTCGAKGRGEGLVGAVLVEGGMLRPACGAAGPPHVVRPLLS